MSSIPSRLLSSSQTRRTRSSGATRRRRLNLESLEERRLLALLGIDVEPPYIFANNTGSVTYTESTERFSADATPLSFQPDGAAPVPVFPASLETPALRFQLDIEVDSSGDLIGGVPGDDFKVTGRIFVGASVFDGVLLTGEVLEFGFRNGVPATPGGSDPGDSYDLRLAVTGGALVGDYFVDSDIGLEIFSEASTFDGSFQGIFSGGNKSSFGPIEKTEESPVFPEIDVEKYTRVDVNPIDIEKLVRVETPAAGGVGDDLCAVHGKVVGLTYQYIPGTTVSTSQDSGKAQVNFQGPVDDDGTSFVIVSDQADAAAALTGGKRFFEGDVDFDDFFIANEDLDDFGSRTYIHFYDDATGSTILQTAEYHTSCSQPFILGDVIGNATLVQYVGETSTSEMTGNRFGPGVGDDDADLPTGPEATAGDTVVFTFVVTNPVPDTQLANVVVTDELLGPSQESLPDPIPVEVDGFNVGDADKDNRLDSGEEWLYTSTTEILPSASLDQQWASSLIDFSTQWGSGDYSASQVLGEPDTFSYGDKATAWAPLPENGSSEFITVGFDTPVHANGVTIRESWGNGFVTKVELLATDDTLHTVWEDTDPSQPGSVVDFEIAFSETSYLVKGVKVHTDTDHDQDAWEEIDAIALLSEGQGESGTPVGLYVDKATVVGTPVNDSNIAIGPDAMDMDPAHFIVVASPAVSGDVCDALGKPVSLTFEYEPGSEVLTGGVGNNQDGKAGATGTPDDDDEAYVIVTNDDTEFFAGVVSTGMEFVVAGNFKANTVFEIYDDLAAFNGGDAPLQTIDYHTSCSKPIQLGDLVGSVTLTAYQGENGSGVLPPAPSVDPPVDVDLGGGLMLTTDGDFFDPDNIGEDADSPTGPIAQIGEKVTWTYVVTNPGAVDVEITSIVDDNETPTDPSDDFTPESVLVEDPVDSGNFFNLGDVNRDGLLNAATDGLIATPAETWYYQAMGIATVPGQHVNKAKVIGEDAADPPNMVMDMDPSHHFVNPLSLEKYTKGEGEDAGVPGQDLCDDLGLHDFSRLTFSYNGDNALSNSQDGKATVTGTLNMETPVWIVGSNKSGNEYFSGEIDLNESFDMTAAGAGASKFSASTFITIYSGDPSLQGSSLLQSIMVHTSCSKAIALGDVFGGVTLVGAEDVTGDMAELPGNPGYDGELGADADNPEDAVPIGLGETVIWTYTVEHLGGTAPMTNIRIVDDAGTPGDASPASDDDFSTDDAIMAIVDEFGFNVGDTNDSGDLDPGEIWLYQASDMVRQEGLYGNKAKVTADIGDVKDLMDMDPSHYVGTLPAIDVCATGEKPVELSMRYTAGNTLSNLQEGRSSVDGTLSDNSPVFIVATGKSSSDVYFRGEVELDEAFTMTADNAGLDKFDSETFVSIYSADPASGGVLLQAIEFHTSCSKPLAIGDEFGGVQLVGFVGDGGTEIGMVPDADPIVTGGSIVSTDPVFNRNKMMITITNNGSTDAVINEMDFEWASSNKKLKKIKADKLTIFDVDTSFTSGGISIGNSDWEGGTLAKRTLKPGESVVLKFEFEKNASSDVANYGLVIRFDLNNDGDSDDDDEMVTLF